MAKTSLATTGGTRTTPKIDFNRDNCLILDKAIIGPVLETVITFKFPEES